MTMIDLSNRRWRERSRTRVTSARPACTNRESPRIAATLFVSLIPLLVHAKQAQAGTGSSLLGGARTGASYPGVPRFDHPPEGCLWAWDFGPLVCPRPGPPGSPRTSPQRYELLTNAARAIKVALVSHRIDPLCFEEVGSCPGRNSS